MTPKHCIACRHYCRSDTDSPCIECNDQNLRWERSTGMIGMVKLLLKSMTDEERMEAMEKYCSKCGEEHDGWCRCCYGSDD